MSESTQITRSDAVGAALERVLIVGDLAKLTPVERTDYYVRVCESLGLNPLTKPFDYIMLSGRLVLYAKRDCTDQLRRIYGISVEIVDRKITEGMLSVHARATDKNGRKDEDFGVVSVSGKLTGDAGANLIMKCVTKAKRRVTLSICGLGMLDETEVETIPDAQVLRDDCIKQPAAKYIAPQRSPAELLRHLEEEFGCCGDLEVLADAWEAYLEQINKLSRSHRAIAEAHFQRREGELEKAAA